MQEKRWRNRSRIVRWNSEFRVPRSTISFALFEMILDKKKELRARKSTNLSFLRLSQRWPILLAVIVLVVHVVAGLQEWLESPLAGPGARRRSHPWERISANVQDHTVELSAFWHVIRRIPTWSALLLPPFWLLPFAPSIVPPPVVHLRGTGKGNLRRNPRLRRLWERNRGRCLESTCTNVSVDTRIPFVFFSVPLSQLSREVLLYLFLCLNFC